MHIVQTVAVNNLQYAIPLHNAAATKTYLNKKLSDHINRVNGASQMMQAAIQGKGGLLRSAGEGLMGHLGQLKAGIGKGGLRDAAKAEMADQVRDEAHHCVGLNGMGRSGHVCFEWHNCFHLGFGKAGLRDAAKAEMADQVRWLMLIFQKR
jgi:hypothetical protein